jgi:hypothetical protein
MIVRQDDLAFPESVCCTENILDSLDFSELPNCGLARTSLHVSANIISSRLDTKRSSLQYVAPFAHGLCD